MLVLKNVYSRIRKMKEQTRKLLSHSLKLSSLLLLSSVIFLLYAGGFSTATYEFYAYARALADYAAAISFIAVILSALMEEQLSQ